MYNDSLAISDAAIRWLSAFGAPPLALPASLDTLRRPIPATHDAGCGTIEILRLQTGLSFSWRTDRREIVDHKGLYPLAHVTGKSVEPLLIIQTVHAGKIIAIDQEKRAEITIDDGAVLFEHVNHIDFTILLDGGEDVEFTTFMIGRPQLNTVLGPDITSAFLNAARLGNVPSMRTQMMPQRISSLLQSSMPQSMDPDLRKLIAQAHALEYICLLATHITGNKGQSSRQQKMQQLYEELHTIEGKLPPLIELASRYGMSVKTMNDHFKRMFGQTIGAFMASHRLNEAHVELEDTDTPMKIIAARIGYAHVSTFINAFTNKYGYSPGSLRRPDRRAS